MTVMETHGARTGAELERRWISSNRDGFLLIEGALSPAETEHIRVRLNDARSRDGRRG